MPKNLETLVESSPVEVTVFLCLCWYAFLPLLYFLAQRTPITTGNSLQINSKIKKALNSYFRRHKYLL